MNLIFKKIILNNFGSYAHTEVDLENKGFCGVTGRNYYKKDNSYSNGCGKSFLWSAICFTLTGETISGSSKDLKNRLIDDNNCYTELTFFVDNDEYIIRRYIAPKSDMTVMKNGIDVSGKGIRESEKKLGELLPDLSKDLIASTILIGQKMPNRFSSFSPSGRKELLEKLTKSDFMIDSVKKRIAERQTELATQMREIDDELLANNTKLNMLNNNLQNINKKIADYKPTDYSLQINIEEAKLKNILEDIDRINTGIEIAAKNKTDMNNSLVSITNEKASQKEAIMKTYTDAKTAQTVEKINLETEIKTLKQEIFKIENIKDVCPTCGRKLDNVYKPDTTDLKNNVASLESKLAEVNNKLNEHLSMYNSYSAKIEESYSKALADANSKLNIATTAYNEYQTELYKTLAYKTEEEKLIATLKFKQENEAAEYSRLTTEAAGITFEINAIEAVIKATNTSKVELTGHVETVKKIDTLVKRDFRGYLLTNIINYINKKAKEYCQIVYGTTDLDITLDGNVLDITYDGKIFDNLSGGEQQRVDLILQFAIRDLLSNYLNYSSNIIVLDEIFDNLDKTSTGKVLELITTKLNDVESVFIISHHADSLNIGFDTTINISKNEDGISQVNQGVY